MAIAPVASVGPRMISFHTPGVRGIASLKKLGLARHAGDCKRG